MPEKGYSLSIEVSEAKEAIIHLSGMISVADIEGLLAETWSLIEGKAYKAVVVDLGNLSHIDTSAAVFLLELKDKLEAASISFGLKDAPERLIGIMDMMAGSPMKDAASTRERGAKGFIETIGKAIIDLLEDSVEVITFGGELVLEMAYAIFHPLSLRWGDVLSYMKRVGVDGLPIVGLISFLLGLVLAFMSSLQLKQFGANIYVPSLLSIAMVRELGPIMTAILVTGRSGSSFAAEIGSMKINEEIDALVVMGFNPVRFLALPKVFASIIVVPILTIFSDIFAIMGGLFIGVSFLELSIYTYIQQSLNVIDMFGFVTSIIKSIVLGVLIAAIGCQRGFAAKAGAEAVGNATTSAVVAGLFLIIVVDSIFAIVLNYIS